MRLYPVMCGEYSDKNIVAIFDDFEEANKYAEASGCWVKGNSFPLSEDESSDECENINEPFILNHWPKLYGNFLNNLKRFSVHFDADGNIIDVYIEDVAPYNYSSFSEEVLVYDWRGRGKNKNKIGIEVWAKDEEHAKKKACDERRQYLAEPWRQIQLKCVDTENFRSKTHKVKIHQEDEECYYVECSCGLTTSYCGKLEGIADHWYKTGPIYYYDSECDEHCWRN